MSNNPNQEFIIARGIPGSGKSTWAAQWVAEDPENRVRVNRDDIRMELFNQWIVIDPNTGYPSKKHEEMVTNVEQKRVLQALREGKSVCSDNTNLPHKTCAQWVMLAKLRNIPVSTREFHVSKEEAIRRDAARDRTVGPKVIGMMYSRLGPNGEFHHVDGTYTPRPFMKPDSRSHGVIYDMDGTLTRVESIRHFVQPDERGRRNFDMFHRSSLFCPPNQEVLEMAHDTTKNNLKNVIVTARQERYREVTELWLNKHGVEFDNLYMRPNSDMRRDDLVKADILKEILKDYDIVHAVDDRPEVIKVWESAGILTTLVPGLNPGEVPDGEEPKITNLFKTGGCLRCGKPLKSGAAIGPRCAQKG